MYRVKRKYAWFPLKVWERMCEHDGLCREGQWRKIWLREYWVVEEANHEDLVDDVCPLRWNFYTGDYYYEKDAQRIVELKSKP